MKPFVLTCLLLLFTLSALAQTENQDIVKKGDTMPAFTVTFDDGRTFSSDALAGKVTLVTFFATWCPPCQKELAEVQARLWPAYKDHASFRLMVIGREHTDAELATYNEKKGFTFPLYPDKDRSVYGRFAKSLIPRSYLINKEGKVIMATTGYTESDFETLLKQIDQALKQ